MPNQGLTSTKRHTQKKEMIESPSRLPPSKFYSPKTPGWVSGKNAIFETPTTPSSTDIQTKKTTRRRETLAVTKTEVSKMSTANKSRRKTMAFKVPDAFSPVTTRSRRSSMFSVSHRKGGVRLNIAVTPQTKTKNTVQPKPVVSPGVKTRARRSTIYQTNTKSVSKTTKDIDPQVISLGEKSPNNLKESKPSPAKRKTRGKSKTPAKKKATPVKTPTSPSRSTRKKGLVNSPAGSNDDGSDKKETKSAGRKTPVSKVASQKRKVEESNQEELLIKFETPIPKKMKKEETTESPVKSRKTPVKKLKSSKVQTPNQPDIEEDIFKTPALTPSKLKSPIRKTKTPRQPKTLAKQTKTPARQSKTPKRTKTPAKQSKTPEQTKTPARQSKTPKQTKTPARQSKTPKQTKTPARQSKTPEQTKSPVKQSKTPEQTKTPKQSKTPAILSKTPEMTKTPKQSKTPAKPPKTPKQSKTPAKPSKTPKQRKTPTKTPEQSKTPTETKIPSATKRKREEGTNKDLPSPVKKAKTPTRTKLDSSPVVLLTKTPMSISEPKSSTPVVVASTLKDKRSPGMKKKVSPKKKSPKSKKDTKNESKVPSLVKKSLKKSKVKLKLESMSDLVHLKKGKRKATPGRNGEVEKIAVQTLHSNSVISKEEKDLDVSKLSKLADLSQENDLTLDSTSHSSTGARCIIL